MWHDIVVQQQVPARAPLLQQAGRAGMQGYWTAPAHLTTCGAQSLSARSKMPPSSLSLHIGQSTAQQVAASSARRSASAYPQTQHAGQRCMHSGRGCSDLSSSMKGTTSSFFTAISSELVNLEGGAWVGGWGLGREGGARAPSGDCGVAAGTAAVWLLPWCCTQHAFWSWQARGVGPPEKLGPAEQRHRAPETQPGGLEAGRLDHTLRSQGPAPAPTR